MIDITGVKSAVKSIPVFNVEGLVELGISIILLFLLYY